MQQDGLQPPPLLSAPPNKAAKRFLLWLLPLVFGASLALSLGLEWLMTQADRTAYSAAGGPDPMFSTMGLGLAAMAIGLIAFFFLIVGGVLVCGQRSRSVGIVIMLCAISFIGGCVGGCNSRTAVFGNPRKEAFMQLGERMMPLVQAVESYHRDNGTYPEQLENLVPKYLQKLPQTQMGNYTNYNYYVGSRAQSFEGNPWIIEIPAGYGMGFDQFYYFPLQNYPQGGPYERMGKWAYFHE